ncbi:MAG: hypothetical protein KC657_36840 [Myxococcales bacterium]|nr:hypothetical protein [Myxococcales bacterium]
MGRQKKNARSTDVRSTTRRRALLGVTASGLVLAAFACGDDDVAPTPGGVDAAPAPETGTALDGGNDVTPAPDAAAPTVVTASFSGGGPVAGLEVIFHLPDGTARVAKTGADGTVKDGVPAGSSVTLFAPASRRRAATLATVMGVGPGDVVPFRFVDRPGQDVQVGAFDTDGGATYFVSVCGSASTLPAPPGTKTESFPVCRDDAGAMPVLFAASTTASPIDTIAWAPKLLPWVDGGAPASALMGAITEWQPAGARRALTVTGTLPVDATAIDVDVSFVHDDIRFGSTSLGAGTLPASLQFVPPPTAFAPITERRAVVRQPSTERGVISRSAAAATDLTSTVDDLLPQVTAVTLSGASDAPSVAYTSAGSVATAHGIVVELVALGDGGDADRFVWMARASGTSGAVTLPKLPAAYASRVSAGGFTTGALTVVAHSGATSAQAFRTQPFEVDAPARSAQMTLPAAPVTLKTSRRAF